MSGNTTVTVFREQETRNLEIADRQISNREFFLKNVVYPDAQTAQFLIPDCHYRFWVD
jgi:hypothetical protein